MAIFELRICRPQKAHHLKLAIRRSVRHCRRVSSKPRPQRSPHTVRIDGCVVLDTTGVVFYHSRLTMTFPLVRRHGRYVTHARNLARGRPAPSVPLERRQLTFDVRESGRTGPTIRPVGPHRRRFLITDALASSCRCLEWLHDTRCSLSPHMTAAVVSSRMRAVIIPYDATST